MRFQTILGLVAIAVVLAGSAYAVLTTAQTPTDWIELIGICGGVIALSIALYERRGPSVRKKRTFTRFPDSDW